MSSFTRPTLAQLVDRIQSDFISRLSLTGALLRRSMVYVLSRVLAGIAHMLYGAIDYLSRQIFPDQSDMPYLIRQGATFGLAPNAPTFARGTVTITGTNSTVIPGTTTILVRADGAEYTVDTDVTISSGTAIADVTASVAGSDGTLDIGVTLSFQSPIAGANSPATVASSTNDGTDAETADEFRVRVMSRMQNPPQGGASADYVAWAKQVPGVTRAWCYPLELGPGTTTVRFVRDDDISGPIPDPGGVTTVQDWIDPLAPVTADVTVVAPIANVQNFSLHIAPDNADTEAAVTAELQDLILRLAEPGATIPLSEVETAVGNAVGVTDFAIATPSADITNATGHMTTMGTVAFT